jgi:uncharacterized protein YndB with AHSA1/START domain
VRTSIDVVIAAPLDTVWRALTVPADVERWAGVTAAALPDDYPQAGQHARWHDRGVVLHDYIVEVRPGRLLASRLARASATVVEHYHLQRRGRGATRLRATWHGHPALADNAASMRLLRRWCETGR